MLSILIPVYNYDVRSLVAALTDQVRNTEVVAEILCYDDKSSPEYLALTEPIKSNPLVSYRVLESNLGRAAIRNLLAKDAKYDKLLFLDCDGGIIADDFIEKYLSHISAPVVAGGRVYAEKAPDSQKKILHWKYGSTKESRSLAERKKSPYNYFHSNNFMISRQLLLAIGFDENISGYGYEDLVLAKKLKEKFISILHVTNPVKHLCIEENENFLEKTKRAVENLALLNKEGLEMETQLEIAATRVNNFGLSGLYRTVYTKSKNAIMKNLLSSNPNLRFLSYYKLYYYLTSK